MDTIIGQLKDLDMKGMSASVKESFDLLNETIKNASVKEISSDIRYSFSQVKSILTADKWNRIMNSMENLAASFAEFSKTSDSAMKSGERLMRNTEARFSVLQRRLMSTVRNFERATSKLNGLIDAVADQPSQVIFSRPPRERDVERENSK